MYMIVDQVNGFSCVVIKWHAQTVLPGLVVLS